LNGPHRPQDKGKPGGNWRRNGEALIVFLVTFVPVLALVYWLAGGDQGAGIALPVAFALAAGVTAARTSKVRSAVISLLSFLQNISQLWR